MPSSTSQLECEELMQEPPHGHNHGNRDGESLETDQLGELPTGYTVVGLGRTLAERSGGGRERVGVNSHRGVLQAVEHVDLERLRPLIEAGLAYTLAQVEEAYKPGRPSAERRALRRRIDARLLHLSNRGGNMTALARIFGWSIRADGECRTMAAALRRAREAS